MDLEMKCPQDLENIYHIYICVCHIHIYVCISYDIPFLLSDVKKMEHVQPLLKSLRAISSSDSLQIISDSSDL